MSDISISPIPYNNGTLQADHLKGHYVLLNPKMILHVNAQTSPNYVFAWVSTTTGNIKAGTATWVAQPMRAIMSFSAAPSTVNQIRLWKLTASRALMLINSDFYVLEVNASNDIVLKSAKLSTFTVSPIQVASTQSNFTGGMGLAASNNVSGSFLTGWSIRDNVVWFSRRVLAGASGAIASGTSIGVEMWKVVYDPTADRLDPYFMQRLWAPSDTNTAQYSYVRTYVVSIPNSTKKLVYVRSQNNANPANTISLSGSYAGAATYASAPTNGGSVGMNTGSMVPIMTIDSVTDAVFGWNISAIQQLLGPVTPNQYIRVIVPLSETKWLLWFNNNQYRVATNSGGQGFSLATPSQIFPAPTTAAIPYHGEALDANYFMLWSSSGNLTDTELASGGSATQYVRIGRIVDNDIAQISAATINAGGLAISAVTWPVLDQEYIQRLDTDAFLMFGRNSSGSTGNAYPAIRVLYQPGG